MIGVVVLTSLFLFSAGPALACGDYVLIHYSEQGRSGRSATMERFETLEDCETAGKHLTNLMGRRSKTECLDLKSGKATKI